MKCFTNPKFQNTANICIINVFYTELKNAERKRLIKITAKATVLSVFFLTIVFAWSILGN